MICPLCNTPHSQVIDSRERGDRVYRRHHCKSCGHRWSSWEIPEDPEDYIRKITKERLIELKKELIQSIEELYIK